MVNFETKFCNLNLLCKKCDRRHIRLAFEFAQVKFFNFDLTNPKLTLPSKWTREWVKFIASQLSEKIFEQSILYK